MSPHVAFEDDPLEAKLPLQQPPDQERTEWETVGEEDGLLLTRRTLGGNNPSGRGVCIRYPVHACVGDGDRAQEHVVEAAGEMLRDAAKASGACLRQPWRAT